MKILRELNSRPLPGPLPPLEIAEESVRRLLCGAGECRIFPLSESRASVILQKEHSSDKGKDFT